MKEIKIKKLEGKAVGVLDRRRNLDNASQNNLTPEWEIKVAISAILSISMKPIGFRQQLKEMLAVLMSISWLQMGNKGGIFLLNNHNQLILKAEHELHPEIKRICSKVKMGQCLCGRAAESKKIVFKSCVDDEHENCFDGMGDHGHYNIPLLDSNGELLGVIVFYLEAHHKQHAEESELMEMIGQSLSNVIANRHFRFKAEISQILQQQAQVDIIHKLVTAAEFRDNETGEHIKRMSNYAGTIAKKMGLSEEDVQILILAAPLHDIGKIGISDNILLKPGKLNAKEFDEMKRHPVIGAEILTGEHPLIVSGREIALSHHEKWDGSGYPYGLAGKDIPIFGRICALADVFDALTSSRPYKKAWSMEKALAFISANSGSHFDPEIVTAFLDSLPEIMRIRSVYGDTNEELIQSVNKNENNDSSPLVELSTSTSEVVWTSEISMKHEVLDEQHRYFHNLVNRIHESINVQNVNHLIACLSELKQYTSVHFIEEEKLMTEANYPKLEEHKEYHKMIKKRILQLCSDLEFQPLAVAVEIKTFLDLWINEHMHKADIDFAGFIEQNP